MRFILVLLSIVFATTPLSAAELEPGDRGYMHKEMHQHYQTIFSGGRCSCKSGECRPTIYRHSSTSPSGYEVKLNGQWIDIPQGAILEKKSVPSELWVHPAHICAFPDAADPKVIHVECAIINGMS